MGLLIYYGVLYIETWSNFTQLVYVLKDRDSKGKFYIYAFVWYVVVFLILIELTR